MTKRALVVTFTIITILTLAIGLYLYASKKYLLIYYASEISKLSQNKRTKDTIQIYTISNPENENSLDPYMYKYYIKHTYFQADFQIGRYWIINTNSSSIIVRGNQKLHQFMQDLDHLYLSAGKTLDISKTESIQQKLYNVKDIVLSYNSSLPLSSRSTLIDEKMGSSTLKEMIKSFSYPKGFFEVVESYQIIEYDFGILIITGNIQIHHQINKLLNHIRDPKGPVHIGECTYQVKSQYDPNLYYTQLSPNWYNLFSDKKLEYFSSNNVPFWIAFNKMFMQIDPESYERLSHEFTFFENKYLLRAQSHVFNQYSNLYQSYFKKSSNWLPTLSNYSTRTVGFELEDEDKMNQFESDLQQLEISIGQNLFYCTRGPSSFLLICKNSDLDALNQILDKYQVQ